MPCPRGALSPEEAVPSGRGVGLGLLGRGVRPVASLTARLTDTQGHGVSSGASAWHRFQANLAPQSPVLPLSRDPEWDAWTRTGVPWLRQRPQAPGRPLPTWDTARCLRKGERVGP